ncbi:pemK-like family protein [Mycobacterium xenopi 3993]|nr:pemK-like family protein [Mycobacterium xenopi 3993]
MFNEAPKFIRQLHNSPGIQRGIKFGLDVISGSIPQPPAAITEGRPVTSRSVPTAQRARKLVYAPDLDGRADPGEIVWTWVVYEDDPTRGKDRPVLVVGRDRRTLLGLMLSSQESHADDPNWVGIGPVAGTRPADQAGFASIGYSTCPRRASAARARS